jgi:hypothetical protein
MLQGVELEDSDNQTEHNCDTPGLWGITKGQTTGPYHHRGYLHGWCSSTQEIRNWVGREITIHEGVLVTNAAVFRGILTAHGRRRSYQNPLREELVPREELRRGKGQAYIWKPPPPPHWWGKKRTTTSQDIKPTSQARNPVGWRSNSWSWKFQTSRESSALFCGIQERKPQYNTSRNIFLNNVFQLPVHYPPHPYRSNTEWGFETIFVLDL